MLQIHFTSDDLGRTRVAAAPDVMWEVVNSIQLLQNREGVLIFDGWRRQVRLRAQRTPLEATIRGLSTLCPHAEYFPDFLTPTVPVAGMEASIDAVLSTPRKQLNEEMSRLSIYRRLPHWAQDVAAGDPDTLQRLGAAVRTFHSAAIEPHLDRINVDLRTECTQRADVVLHGGSEALLNSFPSLMHWTPPVLHVRYPIDKVLHLGGRGLWLVPSFFCWRYPVTLANSELTPILVYPIDHHLGWQDPAQAVDPRGQSGLTALMGSTRAAVLEVMASGRTTTQVARLVGISAATASHHASVLRNANLITTRREANTVVHTLTPLGLALLNAGTQKS